MLEFGLGWCCGLRVRCDGTWVGVRAMSVNRRMMGEVSRYAFYRYIKFYLEFQLSYMRLIG